MEADKSGIPIEDVKHGWLKSDNASLFFTNPLHDDGSLTTEKIQEAIKDILEGFTFKRRKFKPDSVKDPKALKATLSDSHIGMQPNPDGGALFQYEYNPYIYQKSLDKVFISIQKERALHGTFDVILLDDLGDRADGWNGYTTRGGHKLDQNLSNAEIFQICVKSYVKLISEIIEANLANKVILRCINNDNHAGDFSTVINLAIKELIDIMYSPDVVEIDLLNRFIEHRFYGDHAFLLTHGKDKQYMRSGLPLNLNDKAIKYINDYIDHYNIGSKYIHLEKGDLHQIGYQRAKRFDYRNFMSFAPPSAWLQHNFGDSYSGYSIQVVPKHSPEVSHTDYFLEYKKLSE
jgi:hypothetical protein